MISMKNIAAAAAVAALASAPLLGTERDYRISFDVQINTVEGEMVTQPYVMVQNPNDNPASLSTTITLTWDDKASQTTPDTGLTLHKDATDCTDLTPTLAAGEGATINVVEALAGACSSFTDCVGAPPCGDDCIQIEVCDAITGICEDRCWPDPDDPDVPDPSRITVSVTTDDSGTQGALPPAVSAQEIRVDQSTSPARIRGWWGTHLEEQ